MGKGAHCANLVVLGNLSQTSQSVLAVDVHRTGTANTLTARSTLARIGCYLPSEHKSRVLLILDPEKSVQHHGSTTTFQHTVIKTYSFMSTAYFS